MNLENNLIDGKYRFSDIVDIGKLTKIFTKFSNITGFTIGLVDNITLEVLISAGWLDICKNFHRADEQACKVCIKSNKMLFAGLDKNKTIDIIECDHGLYDCATPIIIENVHVANLITGQLLLKEPNKKRFEQQAELYGFDKIKYIEALGKVPIVDEKKVAEVIDYLTSVAENVAEIGLSKLRNERLNKTLLKTKEIAKESENHFQKIASRVSILLYDYVSYPNGKNKFLYVSSNSIDVLEIEPEAFIQDINLFWNMIHKDDFKRLEAENNAADKNNKTFTSEVRVITPSKALKWIEISSVLSSLSEDGSEIWSGYILDITERKTTEQALKASELRYKAIFESNQSVMLLIKPENGKIVDANEAASNFYGYSVDEIKQMNISQINILSDSEIYDEMQNAKNAKRNKFIFKHKLANGEIRDVEVYSGKVTFSDKIFIYSIVYDITERKKIELALKASETKLRKSNKTKDKFFSILAHDLKSPFNSMLGFSTMLNNNFEEYDVEKQKRFTGFIHQGIERTYKLLENLLTWSRSQRGVIDFNPENLNLFLLISEAVDLYNHLVEKKAIKLVNTVDEKIIINADKDMLSTIIRNLLSNAIKFTPRGGKIIVNAKKITEKNSRAFIKIAVKDTGVGVSKEIQSQIFDISENKSTKGTENEEGTGLGLIICKEFVEKHGGKIWVESKQAKGSDFIFTLLNDL